MKEYTIRCTGLGSKVRNCGYANIKLKGDTGGTAQIIKIEIINRYNSQQLKNRNNILFDKIIQLINKYYDLEINNSKCKSRVSHSKNIIRRVRNSENSKNKHKQE